MFRHSTLREKKYVFPNLCFENRPFSQNCAARNKSFTTLLPPKRVYDLKVLAILGSPKGKGNGYKIAQKIKEHMTTQGQLEFDFLLLKDANLKLCKGCFTCISKGEDLCPLKDERESILISPSYVQNVSWLMKNFIDRFAYTNHRPRFFKQKILLVANGGAGLNKTLDSLRNALGGASIVDKLAVTVTPWPRSDNAEKETDAKIHKTAVKFYQALQSKKETPSFQEYMRFRFFKAASPSLKEYLPADYEFYKEKNEYYYPIKIGLGKRIGASIMLKIGFFLMRNTGPRKEK
jgi:multimeric flavodoxin WrbA